VAVAALSSPASAQDKLGSRYGLDSLPAFYPQKTPHEAVESAVKAVVNQRFDYLLAQLAEPDYVDRTVAQYMTLYRKGGEQAKRILAFDRLVEETRRYFLEDPTLVKELRLFARKAEWDVKEDQATATLKSIQGRKVFMKKLEDRWFLENRQQ
jgi:hypothetical protein